MDPLTIAAAGLRSAQLRLATSAHNVANLDTPSFHPLRSTQSSLAGGGSVAHVQQESQPRATDLARELVDQLQASLQFRASLRIVATESETRGRLVDLLA